MINFIQSKTVKITLAATIAVLISTYLELDFGVTSGIIAILSIQDTKKCRLQYKMSGNFKKI